MRNKKMKILLSIILCIVSTYSISAERTLFAESNCKEAYEYHFLNRAVASEDIVGIELLLEGGANVDGMGYKNYPACVAGIEYSSPLMVATYVKNIEIVELLLKAGANPSISEGEGITPLFVAKKHKLTKIIKLLLKYGAK